MKQSNRIYELKQLKNLANTFLSFYISEQQIKTKGWEKDLVKRNISLLNEIIQNINVNLHSDKISEYLKATCQSPADLTNEDNRMKVLRDFSTVMRQGSNFSLLMRIIKCSPKISYVNDLTWFKHGTVQEHIEYGLGKTNESVFEKYLPYQLEKIKALESTFFIKPFFRNDLILLNSIQQLVKSKNFIPANILVITLIEGLVRKFCFLVYKKQNPEKSQNEIEQCIYVAKSSFEALICKTEWEKDILIQFPELLTDYSHTENPIITNIEKKLALHKKANEKIEEELTRFQISLSMHLENPNTTDENFSIIGLRHLEELKSELDNLMTEEDKSVAIGLDIFLDFLVKKFKDDRNHIIHGKYSFFKEKWRTLVYLSALEAVVNKITWYETNVSFDA